MRVFCINRSGFDLPIYYLFLFPRKRWEVSRKFRKRPTVLQYLKKLTPNSVEKNLLNKSFSQLFPLDGGVTIPKDCALIIMLLGLHRNPRHYPNPHRFDPDNFSAEKTKTRHPYSFIPFSTGQRTCFGLYKTRFDFFFVASTSTLFLVCLCANQARKNRTNYSKRLWDPRKIYSGFVASVFVVAYLRFDSHVDVSISVLFFSCRENLFNDGYQSDIGYVVEEL